MFYIWNLVIRKGLARRALGIFLTFSYSYISNFLIITSLQRRLCRIAFSPALYLLDNIIYNSYIYATGRGARRAANSQMSIGSADSAARLAPYTPVPAIH